MKQPVTIPLDAALIARMRAPIFRVWETIGGDLTDSDIEYGGSSNQNINYVEACVDANHLAVHGGDKEAQELMTQVFKQHDVDEVLKFLSRNFRLV